MAIFNLQDLLDFQSLFNKLKQFENFIIKTKTLDLTRQYGDLPKSVVFFTSLCF